MNYQDWYNFNQHTSMDCPITWIFLIVFLGEYLLFICILCNDKPFLNWKQSIEIYNDVPSYLRQEAWRPNKLRCTIKLTKLSGAGVKRDIVLNITTWHLCIINTKIDHVFVDIYRIPEKILAPWALWSPPGENNQASAHLRPTGFHMAFESWKRAQ